MSYHSKQFSERFLDVEKLFSFKRYFMNNADSYHGLSVLNEVSKVLVKNASPPSISDIIGEDVTPRPPLPPELPYEIYGETYIISFFCICAIYIKRRSKKRLINTHFSYEYLQFQENRFSVSGFLLKHTKTFFYNHNFTIHNIHLCLRYFISYCIKRQGSTNGKEERNGKSGQNHTQR